MIEQAKIDRLLADLLALQGQISIDGRHCYRMSKKTVPGVTTVIKTMDAPLLDKWKVRVQVEGTARAAYLNEPWENEAEDEYIARLATIAKAEFEHERLANEAADIGKQVHALIEHAVKSQLGQPTTPPVVSDEALFIFSGWREWAEREGLRPLMSEGRICWPVNQTPPNYCGTFDLLATFDRGKYAGKLAILDAKPNDVIYPERRLQLAAYCESVRQLSGLEVLGFVVSMPRDGGEIKLVPVDVDTQAFAAFLSCLNLHNWLKEVRREDRRSVEVDERFAEATL